MPIDREKVLQAAQKHIEKKRFDRAIAEYQKIVQEDPNDARILLKVGDLQARMEAFEAAIATYERVGRHYAAQGFSVKAIAVYKQIREIIRKHVPRLADQYGHIIPKLAQLYQDLGLTGDALAAYDEYASHLQRSGREREATEIFAKIVEINSNNPLARLRLAEALVRQNEMDEASAQFSAAAEILLGMGRRDDALKVIERMLYQKPDPVLARQTAELYLERGAPDDGMLALAKLQICFQADQRDLETLVLLARSFETIGQTPKAIEVRKEIVRVAREQDKIDLARQVIEQLLTEAGDDEAVRAMARSILPVAEVHRASSHAPPIVPSVEPQSLEVGETTIEISEEMIDVGEDSGLSTEVDSYEEMASDLLVSEPPSPISERSASIRTVSIDDANLIEVQDAIPAEAFDVEAHIRQVLENAETYRRQGQFGAAIQALRIGLEVNPNAAEFHLMLRDLLFDTGDHRGTIQELMILAQVYIDALDAESAAQMLTELLALDPSDTRAQEMLTELGYEIPSELYEPDQVETAEMREPMPTPNAFPGYEEEYATATSRDATERLPSYELEELEPSYPPANRPPAHQSLLTTDDPFSTLDTGVVDEPFAEHGDRLPSFPLGDDEASTLDGPSAHPLADESLASRPPSMPAHPGPEPTTEVTPTHAPAPLAGTRAFQGGDSLEDALEEAEFFASRGLLEDAMSILREQFERFPDHPLLVERIREVEATMNKSSERLDYDTIVPSAPPVTSSMLPDDRSFDIAASLEAIDALDAGVLGPAGPELGRREQTVDVEAVFAKFKEGVKEQVSESDSDTHYDLGVAYKEMGLLSDAIAEFNLAARDPRKECVCWSTIGLVRLEQGDYQAAVQAFIRGLHAEHKTPAQELSLYYDLGNIFEASDNPSEAIFYFQKVARRDPGFRDVGERIRSLQQAGAEAEPDEVKTKVGEDEFDRAFDDLFGDDPN